MSVCTLILWVLRALILFSDQGTKLLWQNSLKQHAGVCFDQAITKHARAWLWAMSGVLVTPAQPSRNKIIPCYRTQSFCRTYELQPSISALHSKHERSHWKSFSSSSAHLTWNLTEKGDGQLSTKLLSFAQISLPVNKWKTPLVTHKKG